MNRRNLLKIFALGAGALTFGQAARAATTHQVQIKGFKFTPASLDVAPGDTIRFSNNDGAPHTATALDKSWDTGTLTGGESAEILVKSGMGGDYRCNIHPSMKGSLKISG